MWLWFFLDFLYRITRKYTECEIFLLKACLAVSQGKLGWDFEIPDKKEMESVFLNKNVNKR